MSYQSDTKVCRKCGQCLPLSRFYKRSSRPDGRDSRCQECVYPHQRPPVEARFWARVERRGPDECWPWLGRKTHGYGKFAFSGGQLAHRFAYELAYGPIPSGLVVEHVCHTTDLSCFGLSAACPHRCCCNPAHLELLSVAENNRAAHRGGSPQNGIPTCGRGHLLTPDNMRMEGTRRRCVRCQSDYLRQYRASGKAKRDRRKRAAVNALNRAVRKGLVQRQDCEECGSHNTSAHHEDYDKPLDVRWLCRTHHWYADEARRQRERAGG
jgi:hypothetical protein